MPGEDPEDRGASRPPHPGDRAWFHPSELQGFVPSDRDREPARRRPVLAVSLVAAALVAGAALLVGGAALLRSDDAGDPTPAASAFGDPVATEQLLADVGVSVLTLKVTRADDVARATGLALGGGRILTGAHTVEGATSVVIVDGASRIPVELVGTDWTTYLTVMRTTTGLEPAPAPEFGSSETVRVGDPVAAVAAGAHDHWNGFGEVQDHDELLVEDSLVVAGLMDSDTGAAPPHSGGPVVDTEGRVVAVLVVPPGTEPSGLALPIETAREVADQLAATGVAHHGWLGLVAADETERAAGGARVEKVVRDGPSAGSGVRRGDVIVAVRVGETTTAVADVGELMSEVRELWPGTMVELELVRDDQERRVTVVLQEVPTTAPTATEPRS